MCERPGCSETGAAAYGMIPEDLVFWLAPIDADASTERVLCRRHADAMVVPRGWTLDDRRDEHLHLFNTHRFEAGVEQHDPINAPVAARRRRPRATVGQLQLDGTGEIERPPMLIDDDRDVALPDVADPDGAADMPEVGNDVTAPWTPTFDDSDDLDGLLGATSPLLARAFRGFGASGGR